MDARDSSASTIAALMTQPQDAPSIVDRPITRFRGQTLRYTDLTGLEKRDYLFEEGIRPSRPSSSCSTVSAASPGSASSEPDTPYTGLFREQVHGLARFSIRRTGDWHRHAGSAAHRLRVRASVHQYFADARAHECGHAGRRFDPDADAAGASRYPTPQSIPERISRATYPKGRRSAFIASSYGDYRLFFKHSDVFLRDELATA